MRIIKGAVSLILVLALLFTAGLTMGLSAAEGAMNAESIKRAMTKTDVVGDLMGDVLADSVTALDQWSGTYEDITQDILSNDELMNSLSGYLASSLSNEIYGEEGSGEDMDVMYDSLIDSFAQELEGLAELEGYDLSEAEEDYIQQAIESELPQITQQIDQQFGEFEAAEEDMVIAQFFLNDGIQAMMAKGFRTLLTVVSVILGIAIIALGWRSKLGFLWCTIVMGALSMLYVTLSLMGEALGTIMGVTDGEAMLLTMLTEGFGVSARTGFVITAVLLAAFIILKMIDKRRLQI